MGCPYNCKSRESLNFHTKCEVCFWSALLFSSTFYLSIQHVISYPYFSFLLKGRDTGCDKSLRHVMMICCIVWLGCDKAACAYFVAAICHTNSNQFKLVWQIAVTMIFTCHTSQFVATTCRGNVSQRFIASCVSALRLHSLQRSSLNGFASA